MAPAGPGVRLDAGYESGDTISQYYDNLVAKLVVWAEDRESARRRMLRALGETEIEGVATTIPADVAILSHPDFIAAAALDPAGSKSGSTCRRSPGRADPRRPRRGSDEPRVLRDVTAEVDGRRYQVKLWVPDVGRGGGRGRRAPAPGPGPATP